MAKAIKRGKAWQIQVRVKTPEGPVSESQTFPTRGHAEAWATERRRELANRKAGLAGKNKTFGDAMLRYAETVSPLKRGERWEKIRLAALSAMPIAEIQMHDLSARNFAEWRDYRLKQVSGATVNREMNLISHVLSRAVREWEWIDESPMGKVSRPAQAPARERRVSQDELDKLAAAAGYTPDAALKDSTSRVYAAFLFAVHTGMRVSEICNIRSEHFTCSVVRLPETKNGTYRDVPLLNAARDLLLRVQALGHEPVFGLTAARTDALWRKIRDNAGIPDLHFHDSRHEAVTRLALRMDVLTLARVIGHRDLKKLMIYYNPTAAEIAARLNA